LLIVHSFKYFKAARNMIDITDCRDLTALQTVLFMIIFLQCSAKMATCYSFVGIALTSSLRMGLHRCVSMDFNPIVRETRKRIFWVIRKMDTYVSALLGLPKTINDEDIDQELPEEVDDEYITTDKILPMPEGQLSMIAAGNAHIRIMRILAKVVKYIYPIKGMEYGRSRQTYKVSHARIREIEADLQDWEEHLPEELRPDSDCPQKYIR
jgi:TnpA family transposase